MKSRLEEYWDLTKASNEFIEEKYGLNKNNRIEHPVGWGEAIDSALFVMKNLGYDLSFIRQIKSKFCQLVVYYNKPEDPQLDKEIEEIVKAAQEFCNKSCERCGEPHGLKTPLSGAALCKACASYVYG